MARLLLALVRFYQLAISPWLRADCRFEPSCSAYAVTCIERFGALRGLGLAARRVMRCHPFGGFGFDPPPALDERAKES